MLLWIQFRDLKLFNYLCSWSTAWLATGLQQKQEENIIQAGQWGLNFLNCRYSITSTRDHFVCILFCFYFVYITAKIYTKISLQIKFSFISDLWQQNCWRLLSFEFKNSVIIENIFSEIWKSTIDQWKYCWIFLVSWITQTCQALLHPGEIEILPPHHGMILSNLFFIYYS